MGKFLIIEYTITIGDEETIYSKANYTKEEILSELISSNYNTIPIIKSKIISETNTATMFNFVAYPNNFRINDGGDSPIENQFGFYDNDNGTILSIDNEGNIIYPDGTPVNEEENDEGGATL